MENVANKVDGASTLPASEFNSHKNELQAFITESGQTLALATVDQLRKAVSTYARGLYCADSSGTPNVIVLSRPSSLIDAHAYYDGMTIMFDTANANTGATTVNFNALGVKKVRTSADADLTSGALLANIIYTLVYKSSFDSGVGAFVIDAGVYAPIASPTFTGTPTAPNFSYKPTPVTITSWSYVTTTITLNVASHTFVAGDYIEVGGLTATTNIPNGVHLVTSVTATTIVFTYALTPTGTAGVSSATVKGYMTTNGRVEGIGVGQTWQDVTVSRALGTTYTNTSGKPRWVKVTISSTATTRVGISLNIDGVTINESATVGVSTGAYFTANIIIPNGVTYSAVALSTGTLYSWFELR